MITRQTALAKPLKGEAYRLGEADSGYFLFAIPEGEAAGPRTSNPLDLGLYPRFYAKRTRVWTEKPLADRIAEDVKDFCAEHSRVEGVVYLPPPDYLDADFLHRLSAAFAEWRRARRHKNLTKLEKYPNALSFCQRYWRKPFMGHPTLSAAPLDVVADALNKLEKVNITGPAWGKFFNRWGLSKDGKRGKKSKG